MNAAQTMIQLANTAHQREVADLQAAGLNPILSANSNGAAVPNLPSNSKVSAKSMLAAIKNSPENKALDVADSAIKAMQETLNKRNSARTIIYTKDDSNLDGGSHAGVTNHNDPVGFDGSDTLNQITHAANSALRAAGINGIRVDSSAAVSSGLSTFFKKFINSARNAILRENGY